MQKGETVVKIKNIIEISKEDTVLRYSEDDRVICIMIDGRIIIGRLDTIGIYEDKQAIRIDTTDINEPYKYSSMVILLDEIEGMVEDNDTNREMVGKLLLEQFETEFTNSLAEKGVDAKKIETLFEKIRNISKETGVAVDNIIKCVVYCVENDEDLNEYL